MILCEVIFIKLLTLNTHSLVEKNYKEKLLAFTDTIIRETPDIIALQEVNQSVGEEIVQKSELSGFCPYDKKTVIRKDNHAYNVVKILRERGLEYEWTWYGMKLGYGRYEEGLALLSRSPIISTDVVLISGMDDYQNWKTRKIIGIYTEKTLDTWFYSVHMGWWDDKEESFQKQWERTNAHMKKYETVWLMGDFNNAAGIPQEGYEMIQKSGWHDSYCMAEKKDGGITMAKVIDGWKDKITDTNGMRIDHIWCNKAVPVKSSKVIFNGINEPVVSDHYGVLVEL